MITLGIETSCDETACGIVNDRLEVKANKLYSQIKEHALYGGVVPEIAARAHLEKIHVMVQSAIDEAQISLSDIDLIAYTRGPGLMGPLLVGASFARGLAKDLGKPCVGINHLEGHIAANYLSFPDVKPPFLCLTVSGGHTELVVVRENFQYEMLGKTRDDAAGEAFDKCGKLLNLGYPAGPIIGKTADGGKRDFVKFPRGLSQEQNADFSFSGLKTSVLRYVESQSSEYLKENLQHVCASVEEAIVDILVKKCLWALEQTGLETVMVCGGVSANRHLRKVLGEEAQKKGFRSLFPQFSLCTDNGAMIAGIAQLRYNQGHLDLSATEVKPWLPLAVANKAPVHS